MTIHTPHAVCPCCGQVVVPTDPILPPIKRRIFEAVQRRPGIDAESLRTAAWAHDPAGGPENPKCLHVHVSQLNKRLRPLGFELRGYGGYRIVSLAETTPSNPSPCQENRP